MDNFFFFLHLFVSQQRVFVFEVHFWIRTALCVFVVYFMDLLHAFVCWSGVIYRQQFSVRRVYLRQLHHLCLIQKHCVTDKKNCFRCRLFFHQFLHHSLFTSVFHHPPLFFGWDFWFTASHIVNHSHTKPEQIINLPSPAVIAHMACKLMKAVRLCTRLFFGIFKYGQTGIWVYIIYFFLPWTNSD